MTNKIKLNAVQKFLIWSAGADHEVLARESCLTERYKYESLGRTVVLTSVMAFFSGGYAFFSVFGSIAISCALGTVWSCIIFNLDRFFILTSSRNKSKAIFQFTIASCLRLLIAIILSLVVAKPLELRLFEKEINQEIPSLRAERQREERRKQQEEWRNSEESRRIDEIDKEIDSLDRERQQLNNQLSELTLALIQERNGKGLSGSFGIGPDYRENEARKNEVQQQLNVIQNRIRVLNDEKEHLVQHRDLILKVSVSDSNEIQQQQLEETSNSLLDRISALESLSEKDFAVSITSKLITLLFIIIELSPILVKFMSKEELYEALLEEENSYRICKENLQNIKEKELLKIEELKDFELKVEDLIIEYFRNKERNKEKVENIGIYGIESIFEQHEQETIRFLQLCRGRIEHYEHLTNKVLASDKDELMFEESRYTQNGAKGQQRNQVGMLD